MRTKAEVKEYLRQYYLRNRSAQLERQKRRRKEMPAAEKYARHRVKTIRKYGILPFEYDSMMRTQGGVCAICQRAPKINTVLYIDHCHTSKRVRGLLCRDCNTSIGLLGHDASRLVRAAIYLAVEVPPIV